MLVPENDDLAALLRKISAAAKGDDSDFAVFTKHEVKEIRNMLSGYAMLQSWGKLGKIIIWVIITAAALKVGVDNLGWAK